MRALRAMIIVPGLFALCFEVIGNQPMTFFAVFGAFGALLFASFGGSRRDRAVAHLGLAVAGSAALTIGSLVSGSAWLAAVVTVPVTFAIFFAGVAGPNAASGITATLLAYVLPVASASPVSVIPWRLAGWLLASAVSAAAVLLFSPKSAGDELRASAAACSVALAHHLEATAAGRATRNDANAAIAAKDNLFGKFSGAPYPPIGLGSADQGLARVAHMLEWCTAVICDAMRDHLDLSKAAPQDRRVLSEAALALRSVAALVTRKQARFDLRPIWQARRASAARMQELTGDEATVRSQVNYAFHAQSIGLAASAAAADAMTAGGQVGRELVTYEAQRWVEGLAPDQLDGQRVIIEGQQPRGRWPARLARLMAADTTSRSVWFRNSARGAIAIAGAVGVARFTNVQHGFWVVLGTLSVLRTSASATGATAVRALGGTLVGFVIGAALVDLIGTSQPALWAALPIAVLVAAYTPGTAPFSLGQAAFTVALVVLFNLLGMVGWRIGLVRFEDVALGCAVSAAVGILFWPRGAGSVVGDNLAEALRCGGRYFAESVRYALGLGLRHPADAVTAVGAGRRLDEAVRGYLNEQGSKRITEQDLWVLVMAAQRIRLTAHSLASFPCRDRRQAPAWSLSAEQVLRPEYLELTAFYDRIAAQVGSPARGKPPVTEVPLPAGLNGDLPVPGAPGAPGADRRASYSPYSLWVLLHISQLEAHAAVLPCPAARLAAVRRTAWWHSPPPERPERPRRQPG